jgi:hypothetical protein
LHGVDAVSGGTITSNGVTEMLKRTLGNYMPYFKTMNKSGGEATKENGMQIDSSVSISGNEAFRNNKAGNKNK